VSAERWLPVVGVPGYLVSDLGRVMRADTARILKGGSARGYLKVCLSTGGETVQRYIHRLVLEAFAGPCPSGMEARHLDGDQTRNHADNLLWGDRVQQAADRRIHGTQSRKLNEEQVLAIRAGSAAGRSVRSLATEYGVSHGAAHAIVTRRAWRHVP
jgi:hypothetical protein